MVSNKNLAKSSYDFDEKEAYNKYKEYVLNVACLYYCKWKNKVSEKHQNKEIDTLINFKEYLNTRLNHFEHKVNFIPNLIAYIVLCITFGVAILSLLVALQQYQYSVNQDINNTHYEQLEEQDYTSDVILHIKIEDHTKSKDLYIKTSDAVIFSLWILFCIFGFSATYLIKLHICNRKIQFFNNYIKIIDDLIIEKEKQTTEDKA